MCTRISVSSQYSEQRGIWNWTLTTTRSIIIDYVPTKRLPKTRKLFWYGLNLATVVVGIGFYEFETNDVGLVEGVKRVWTA